jgi:sulfur transfer protein SufE
MTISDENLFDLYEFILKESSKRWKRVIKEGSNLSNIKEEKKKMLQEFVGCMG